MNAPEPTLGVLMLDLEGTTVSDVEKELLQRPSVGGLILFSRNYESVNQLRDLIASVRECRSDILIAVDQEGGRVQRLRDGFLQLPALHAIAETALADPAHRQAITSTCGWAMAAELRHYDIDFSFAPVLDLFRQDSPVIKERAFAAEPAVVVALARAYIAGMQAAGMAATGKHFPGHGTVSADSHVELPVDERSFTEIEASDYSTFAGCIDLLDAIMPAHVIYPQVDAQCAGFSEIWIKQKLRQELGFDGVVFSDDLSMVAAHGAGSPETRAELALHAGCDMVLVCNDRACALTVADWLEAQGVPGNAKLPRMRGRPADNIANLYATSSWLAAKQLVESITDNTSKRQ